MRKNSIITTLAAMTLAASMTSAVAAPHTLGAYIEGNLGTTYATFNLFGHRYSAYDSLGLNGNLGYQFNQYIAAEAGYTNYGFSGNSLNNVDVAAKFILPFNVGKNDYTVFAKLGAADVFTSGSNTVMALVGVGGSYSVTQKLDINIQSQSVSQEFFSIGLLSAGLTYHFD